MKVAKKKNCQDLIKIQLQKKKTTLQYRKYRLEIYPFIKRYK